MMRWIIILQAVLVLLAPSAAKGAASPALDLNCVYSPGDTVLVERTIATDLTRDSTQSGVRVSLVRDQATNRYVYLQTILEVWPTGRPKTIRRTYRVATITRPVPGRTVAPVVKTLQGKTVTVTNSNGIAEVHAPQGLDPDDVESLDQALNEDFERIALVGVHKLGDTWQPIPRVDLVIVINATCTGLARFDSMVDYGGRRCARIHLDSKVAGVSENGAELVKDGPTVVIWAPDLRRTLAATTKGSLKLHLITRQGADIVDVNSVGSMQVDRKMTWLKVDGKTVQQPPPTSRKSVAR